MIMPQSPNKSLAKRLAILCLLAVSLLSVIAASLSQRLNETANRLDTDPGNAALFKDESSIPASATPPTEAQTTNATAVVEIASEYVGSSQCKRCHEKEFESYSKTTHSQSFRLTDSKEEPPPTSFIHRASARYYEVIHDDQQLIHRETILDDEGESIAVTAAAMKYTVGSGTHARTYLFESDGFLVESPLTWYQDIKSWAMSPGYDSASHFGFTRTASSRCVFCHVGSIDPLEGNPHRFSVSEPAIGCERCHGPGAGHIAKHDPPVTLSVSAGMVDRVVHPTNLSREIGEAICQQCHLQGAVSVESAESTVWDYRPGDRLTSLRSDFQYETDGQSMKIVGHVEQMQASVCYQQSKTMTCTTCHNPHAPTTASESSEVYRQACFSCHGEHDCGLELKTRVKRAGNDCAHCHMPVAPTNVTHAAFHNHRIAVYDESPVAIVGKSDDIFVLVDDPTLAPSEVNRRKALAMHRIARRNDPFVNLELFHERSTESLFNLHQGGVNDSELLSALAMDAVGHEYPEIAEILAQEVMAQEQLPTAAYIEAVRLLGELAFHQGKSESALSFYRRLSEHSREATDWYYLGLSEQNSGNTTNAIVALENSLRIDPTLIPAHQALAAILSSIGQEQLAATHIRDATRLEQRRPREDPKSKSELTIEGAPNP